MGGRKAYHHLLAGAFENLNLERHCILLCLWLFEIQKNFCISFVISSYFLISITSALRLAIVQVINCFLGDNYSQMLFEVRAV